MAGMNGSAGPGDVVLDIQGLAVEYQSRGSVMRVLPGVNLTISRGEVVGLVGESGSGKSTLALTVLRLLPANGKIAGGRIILNGTTDIASLDGEQLRHTRGEKIAMIFQDPLTSLNPTFRIGHQMVDVQAAHCAHRVRREDRKRVPAAGRHAPAPGRPARPGARRALLPAPALRRHAPARGDRHGSQSSSPSC